VGIRPARRACFVISIQEATVNKFVKVLFALGLTVLMATPALAEFNLYGSARMSTFYIDASAPTGMNGPDGKDSYQNLHYTLQTNSRLGAKFATGDVTGQIELGLEGNENGNTVYTRLIYGVWKFDGGNLLVGQTYTPYTFFSEQVIGDDNDFIGFGATYDSRQPMIKVSLDNGLYLALIQPKSTAVVADSTVKSFMPKVAVGFDGKAGIVKGGLGFAYNAFTDKISADNNGGVGFSETISSYLAYLHGAVDLNPFDVSLAAHYGQNLNNMGIGGRSLSTAVFDTTTNKLEDADSYGGWLQLGYKLAENTKLDAGVGYVHDHNKAYEDLGGSKDSAKVSYFVNAQIKIAKGFMIVPEFDYFQFYKGYRANSNALYVSSIPETKSAGAKWQMDF
jgi:hypothetical protein